MQITVTIPDELAAQAAARGLVLDSYLPELLAKDLATESSVRLPAAFVAGDEEAARRHAAVDRIRALRQGNVLGGLKIKDLVEEGRKY
jgi:hypothetical protein